MEVVEQTPLWQQLQEEEEAQRVLEEFQRQRPEILTWPSLELRTKCTTIEGAESTLNALELALRDPLGTEYMGVGLSANQIGKFDRVCIVRFGDYHLDLIGPTIIEHSQTKRGSTEGCLSCPNLHTTVMRWEEIVVRADNYSQPLIIKNFDVARIIQHELDHLSGYLLVDHAVKIGRNDPCPCGSKKKYKKCCGA